MNTLESSEYDIWEDRFEVPLLIDGVERKLIVRLDKTDAMIMLNGIDLHFWDVDTVTDAPRMHVFLSKLFQASIEERQARIELWAQTMGELDAIMLPEAGKVYKRQDLADHLLAGRVPRPHFIVLEGANKSLRALYEALHFPIHDRAFRVPWDFFVQVAKSGEFVAMWKKLKGL